jgi:hypothetical protein
MDKIQERQLRDMAFHGKAVFMVHLKQEKQYWERSVPPTVEVRTSHSLGFRAIRQAYQINTGSVNELKVAYMLDRLIPDEPDTATQRERLMQLIRAIFERHADANAPTPEGQTIPDQPQSRQAAGPPAYRDVVITLSTLAKKEACMPHDRPAIDAVLGRFAPYYHVFRTKLDKLDRKKVLGYVDQTLELSVPKEGVLEEYDYADQIWLPAIFEDVPLEWVDTLLIEEKPGFYEAEKRMVDRWRRNGTAVIEVVPEPPPKLMRDQKTEGTTR